MSAVVIIGIIVIVAVLVGGGLAYYFSTKKTAPAPAPGPAPTPAGKCTTATQSTKCSAPTPYCKLQSGADYGDCVGCTLSSQCNTGQVCSGNQCITTTQSGCLESANCSTNLNGKLCYIPSGSTTGSCVECLATSDCASKPGTVCGPSKTCTAPAATTCANNASCLSVPGKTKCLKETGALSGVCVACLESSDCASGMTCTANVCVAPPASSGPQYIFRENHGCGDGKMGPYMNQSYNFTNAPPINANGITFCYEQDPETYFYRSNDNDCPSGSNKVGHIDAFSMDVETQPGGSKANGITVCKAPKGYAIPANVNENMKLFPNIITCPTDYPIKIAYIRNGSFDNSQLTNNNSYGVTVCRK